MPTNKEPVPTSPELSAPRKQLIEYVKALAVFEGGETPDILFSGAVHLDDEGRILCAEVICRDIRLLHDARFDPRLILDLDDLLYALTVRDALNNEIEHISIVPSENHVDTAFDGAEPFGEDSKGAPDYMIQSFFARYWLDRGPMHVPLD